MPQEKPVRDFMETIGTFYELIDEKSPFEDEKRSYEGTKADGHVIHADFDLRMFLIMHVHVYGCYKKKNLKTDNILTNMIHLKAV